MKWKIEKDSFVIESNIFNKNDIDIIYDSLEELNRKVYNRSDSVLCLGYEEIAQMSVEMRDMLLLPKILPYRMSITTSNTFTGTNFRYKLNILKPDGTIFINPKFNGPYVKISNEQEYTLNFGQYLVSNNVNIFNSNLEENIADIDRTFYNMFYFAKIKDAAISIDAKLDEFSKKQNIIIPHSLGILPKQERNGDITVEPIIMNDNCEPDINSREFALKFKLRPNVSNVYVGSKGFYVITPEINEGLFQIKKNKIIRKKDKEKFFKNPSEFYSSEVFDFNMSSYSDRVTNYGEYNYKNESYDKSGIKWLPAEGILYNDDKKENTNVRVSIDNVYDLDKLITEAQSKGQTTISYNNKEIPITVKLITDVYNYVHKRNYNNVDERITTKIKRNKNILLIADNFEGEDYSKKTGLDNSNTIFLEDNDIHECLKEGITLLEHQKKGLAWLLECYSKHQGALLADDMGLGKTLQTLCFLAVCKKMLDREMNASVLIVAPVSLMKNWEEEYYKFIKPGIFTNVVFWNSENILKSPIIGKTTDDTNIYDFSSIENDNIVVTTYESLRKYQMSFGRINWSVMILDEAQKIKNPTALATLAVKAMKYEFGLCLTGTPIENTWIDIWSIMDFVSPGTKLGSLIDFKNKFITKLKKNKDNEDSMQKLGQQLNNDLKPLFMRRLKDDLSKAGTLPELPNKNIHILELDMPEEQLTAYDLIINEGLENAMSCSKGKMLAIIGKLRDVSLFPGLSTIDENSIFNYEIDDIIHKSARLMIVFNQLDEIMKKGEKALVFVESKKMQRILRYIIREKYYIQVLMPINGDMDGIERQNIVDSFNNISGFSVLILSPLAAGTGLNIVSANHVFHLSRHWNPAKEDQATDRVYRIGQTKNVEVYIPLAIHPGYGAIGSFDCKLNKLLEYKRNLSNKALFPVGDSEEDGFTVYNDLFSNIERRSNFITPITIKDLDVKNGYAFEKAISLLYNKMGYDAEKTRDSNDNGADVVAISNSNGINYLIQCKKTENISRNIGKDGIQEVVGALKAYEKLYNKKFHPVVITNAIDFTSGAKSLADFDNVDLISREKLSNLFNTYKVNNFYV